VERILADVEGVFLLGPEGVARRLRSKDRSKKLVSDDLGLLPGDHFDVDAFGGTARSD